MTLPYIAHWELIKKDWVKTLNDVGNIIILLVCLLLPLNQLNSTILLIFFFLELESMSSISDHNFVYQGPWKYDVCWSNTTLLYFLHLRSGNFISDHNFVYQECIKEHTFYWIIEWYNLIYFSFTFVIAKESLHNRMNEGYNKSNWVSLPIVVLSSFSFTSAFIYFRKITSIALEVRPYHQKTVFFKTTD